MVDPTVAIRQLWRVDVVRGSNDAKVWLGHCVLVEVFVLILERSIIMAVLLCVQELPAARVVTIVIDGGRNTM